ncbi:Zn-dependent oligopeptidase [Myxococcota bacterium]|nr:Zn-dependent oligopeptidase [Myxococcota bacterium]
MKAFYISLISLSIFALSCTKEKSPDTSPDPQKKDPAAVVVDKTPPPKVVKRVEKPILVEPGIWNTVAEVEAACEKHLAKAEEIRKSIIKVKGTPKGTLNRFNNMYIEVDRVLPLGELIAAVHPEKPVRTAAEKCQQRAKKFVTAVNLDTGLYITLSKVNTSGLDAMSVRFVKKLLLDYKRAGIDKDEATRTKLKALQAKMTTLGQQFDRNIKEDVRFIMVKKADLKGLPQDFIKGKKVDKKGKVKITTAYPDLFPFLSYAKNENLRKKLYQVYLARAYPKNDKILLDILKTRYAYAKLLGYTDWAAYNAEDKMVKSKKVIEEFITRVANLSRGKMKSDLKEILARKKKDNRRAKIVGMWDRFYYVKKIKAEKFKVDPKEVRSYFNYNNVKQGVMGVAQEMYGITFVKAPGAKVWHSQVEAYDVKRDGKIIARFYLDMHPRDGKYGHAAEFTVISGIRGLQVPSAALVCNFADPSKTDGGPALMEHSQVTTFFHEFGHLMHQLLAGNHHWITQTGINCEWDFVEAPSQLMEEWAWNHDILSRFAKHFKTGAVIPKDLVEKMRKADEFGKGVHVMRQMFFAQLSYYLHSSDPSKFNLLKELKALTRKMSPYPYLAGTYSYANFGHLNGYTSMYYTYMWSLVMAKDLLTRFEKEGMMNKKVTTDYMNSVLVPGGSEDAALMVKHFLGRDYSFAAFKTWLEK